MARTKRLPAGNRTVGVRLPPTLIDEVDRIASKSVLLDRSSAIRLLVEEALRAGFGRRILETKVSEVVGFPA